MPSLEDKVRKFLATGRKSIPEVAKELGYTYQQTVTLLRSMVTSGEVVSEKGHKLTYYRARKSCLLAELFYPKDKILERFTIKGVVYKKLDNFPVVSYGGSSGWAEVSRSYDNTVYLGGE
jgi:hypothetical protein|tara:strand:- start:14739 stop:15098 length:360 start_codon:yes stop_codon:yes gene_type:complete